MTDQLDSILELAKDTALEAGRLIKHLREEDELEHQYKEQLELVTNADLAADRMVVARIKEIFPDHRFLTEESFNDKTIGHDLSSPLWIIDPIDGTVNYAHHQQMVGVSIAYACDREVQCGAVYNPFMDELFFAKRGSGARLNGKAIQPSGESVLRKALFASGFPYNKAELDPILPRIELMLRHCQDFRRLGSAALDICWVACGRLDVYFESLSPWDFAAARLIALEAGARCGHFSKAPSDIPECIYEKNLLISTPKLFDEVHTLLKPTA